MTKPLHGSLTHDMLMEGVALTRLSVTDSAKLACVGTSSLPNRKFLAIFNTDAANTIYWGSASVTVGSGYPIPPGAEVVFAIGTNGDVTVNGITLTTAIYVISSIHAGVNAAISEGR